LKARLMDTTRIVWPSIVIDERASEWIRAIVDNHETEVGFFACVERNENTYFIRNVEYPRQNLVTGATCEMDRTSQTELQMKLINEDRESDLGKMKVWGHSHVNMGVGPSKQDEDQAHQFVKEHCEGTFMVRLIVNKKRDMNAAIFDYERNVIFEDVTCRILRTNAEIIDQGKIDRITAAIAGPETSTAKLAIIQGIITSNENTFYKEACDYVLAKKPDFIPKTETPSYQSHHQGDLFSQKNYTPIQEDKSKESFGRYKGGFQDDEDDERLRTFRRQVWEETREFLGGGGGLD